MKTNDYGLIMGGIMGKKFEKRFNQGDIVYWCHSKGHEYSVKYGLVDEQFSDAVIIDYLAPRERRLVDGIPINEFESEQRYRKLPKGWSYDTKLFDITYKPLTEDEVKSGVNIKSPKSIQNAYSKGYLVKDSTIFHGNIEAEVTKNGFRIIKTYPMGKYHIDHVSIRPDKIYFTYEAAEKEVDENIAEFKRQSELTDYDWSVEQIDKTLKTYQAFTGVTDRKIQQYRNWLLSMNNIEDIETRMFCDNIQWKYWKNKRWNNIEL